MVFSPHVCTHCQKVCHGGVDDAYGRINKEVLGVRVVQVRVIFSLPRQFGVYSRPLGYIEWFTPLRDPDSITGLRHVIRSTRQLHRNAAAIHVDEIVRPCHLIPKMGRTVDPRWKSADIYETASDFYLNDFIDVDMFCVSTAIP